MIARILDDKKEYRSYVFAHFIDGFDSSVIVFDSSENRYKHVNMYNTKPHIVRKVFIIDTARDGWTSPTKDTEGYDWLVNDPTLIKSIKRGNTVSEEYLSRAIELNKTIVVNEWTEVKTEDDVENLMTAALDFHDSYIKRIEYNTDKMTVIFENCWNSTVTLEFEGDIALRYIDNEYNPVYESSVIFNENYVYWVDEFIKSVADIKDEHIVLRGRALRWKQTIDNDRK